MMLISSVHNQAFKDLKSLKDRRGREEKELYYVEGVRIVEEALTESTEVAEIAMSDTFSADSGNTDILVKIDKLGIKTFLFTQKLFVELADTETPQGILAVMRMPKRALLNELAADGRYLVLDSIRDPGNMGTIIRTADAAGFSGVILTKGCVDIYNPKVLRSTMGSVFHLPVYREENAAEAVRLLKAKGIRIFVSHLEGSVSIFEAHMNGGLAIVVGSEAEGVSEDMIALADVLVRIPMPGRAESLNASVAAGIMIYEAVRQELSDKCCQAGVERQHL